MPKLGSQAEACAGLEQLAESPAMVRDLLGHSPGLEGESYMKQKWLAAWQLSVYPAWPWRALETTLCFPKQSLQKLFSQRPEEMPGVGCSHPTPGAGWGSCTGHCRAQHAAVCTAGCGEGPLPLCPSPGCLQALCSSEKQVPEHPKSEFNALIPFRQIRNLVHLHPLQALMWHSFLLDHY